MIAILFVVYFAIIMIFAGCVYGLANLTKGEGDKTRPNKKCIAGPDDTSPDWFQWMDVITLSWTTFSTVGYGNVYPLSTSNDGSNQPLCIIVGLVLSFEAFLGVIYASLAAGIVVGVISQQGSKAEVRFSSIIVIRERTPHHKGCNGSSCEEDFQSVISSAVDELSMDDFSYDGDENKEDDEDLDIEAGISQESRAATPVPSIRLLDSSHSEHPRNFRTLPAPVMEFRIANERWRTTLSWTHQAKKWWRACCPLDDHAHRGVDASVRNSTATTKPRALENEVRASELLRTSQ